MFKYSMICNKHVISSHSIVLTDFEHLKFTLILRTSSLEYFVIIKEQVYPEPVQYFYSNLAYYDTWIQFCVKNKDINITLERFAQIFQLSSEGVDIFNLDLHDFEYPNGETAFTTSRLWHDDKNWTLVKNEEVKYYTLPPKSLPRLFSIIFSQNQSHIQGCALLLVYCLLKGIRVNIPKLIIDFMLFGHLLIPSRNLPYRMILTWFFKHLKIDLSGEKAIAPFVDINRTLLKKTQADNHAHAQHPSIQPQAPFVSGSSSSTADPYVALITQIQDLSLKFTSAIEKILAN